MTPAESGRPQGNSSVPARVMVVDDLSSQRHSLVEILRSSGYSPIEASDGRQALERFQTENPDAVLLDVRLPGLDGLSVLREIRRQDMHVPVIMMTGFADVRTAVRSMRLGAQDYLTKPLRREEVTVVLAKVLKVYDLSAKVARVRETLTDKGDLFRLMGPGTVVRDISLQVDHVAGTDFTVVISGESGVGKELVARAVHQRSRRSGSPFVALDCGAIAETLAESELFGHEKGSFTGADRLHRGCFEQAGNGTLFLDEIGNLSINVQTRLLRVLQERQVRRIGGDEVIPVHTRVIVSTLQPLEQLVRENRFRQDLFYRLNEFSIKVPPLRERPEDVTFLAERFIGETSRELDRPTPLISPEAAGRLINYPWPGNVRELRNVCRRAALLAADQVLPEHLNIPESASEDTSAGLPVRTDGSKSLTQILDELHDVAERKLIRQALAQTGGNKAAAARLLKINYKTLYVKMRRHQLT